VPEPLGGAHAAPLEASANLKVVLLRHLEELQALSPRERCNLRYRKFRSMGQVIEQSLT
jgi:acetyl-CoA carboxylase carboxyl transferase subunit alpha